MASARPRNGLVAVGAVRSAVRSILVCACLIVASAAGVHEARALDASAFGWRTKQARGTRPLLVIWVRQPDDTPPSEIARRKQYYEELLFGRPRHRDYPDALRRLEPTLVDYYRDQSGGQFTWRRAGFVGPLSAPIKGKSPLEIAQLAVAAAAREGHVNFRAFDTNHDGTISVDELAVLIIGNVRNGQANHFRGNRAFAVPGQGVKIAAGDGVVGEGVTFATIAHELFHTLGGIDLYGPWHGCYGLNNGLSLMASTGGIADGEKTVDLDPWHKMLVGWIEPRLVAIGRAGRAQLAAQHLPLAAEPQRKRPLLVYDPARGKSEFFLLEYRTSYRLGYDQVATSGLVIWHVAYGANNNPTRLTSERQNCKGAFVEVVAVFVRGAPDWRQGVSKAYTSAHGDVALRWMNGADSGVRVRVSPHKPSDAAIEVAWTAPEKTVPAASASTGVRVGDRL